MLRVVFYALAILHLGPGIAFAVMAFGCGEVPLLAGLCQKSEIQAFAYLTAGLWVLMGLGAFLKFKVGANA
ncbi:hypothetical protein [Rubrivivax albus]|uniref:Uncharacterized protein n=1 Tax=Rubrivivax albus TaxID=2499835 RepID=A0A3S2U486_9BURK|nr:hypothetical protein [Rubrivivax albus]RVT47228.1 hypothetical protein ENE75_24325 [Rubrivivax albus]